MGTVNRTLGNELPTLHSKLLVPVVPRVELKSSPASKTTINMHLKY